MNEFLKNFEQRKAHYEKMWNQLLDEYVAERKNGDESRSQRVYEMAMEYQGRLNEMMQIKSELEQAGIL